MKKILLWSVASALLVAALVCGLSVQFAPKSAVAQTVVGFYDKFGTKSYRTSSGILTIPTAVANVMVTVWNTTDSTITDGSVVMTDTTSTIKRVGVRNYLAASATRHRVLGLAYGNIPRSSTGQPGRVLILGYHPNALLAASNLSAGGVLKVSLSLNGCLAAGDTLSGNVGYLLGGNVGTITGPRYSGPVIITRPLSTMAGATL